MKADTNFFLMLFLVMFLCNVLSSLVIDYMDENKQVNRAFRNALAQG